MKKALVVVLALVMILMNAVGAVAEENQALIQRGDYNETVITLHQKLNELGYFSLRPESPWSERSINALKLTQAAVGLEPSGEINDEAELEAILALDAPLNLVWDGYFEDIENRWTQWSSPTLVESVEIDGKTWMHLISTGGKYEGLAQNIDQRSGLTTKELLAGCWYKLAFTAYAAEDSMGKEFNCGLHNRSVEDNKIQEQYWTPNYVYNAEPTEYEFRFQSTVDGWFRIMIGTGLEGAIEAYYTDVRLEKE